MRPDGLLRQGLATPNTAIQYTRYNTSGAGAVRELPTIADITKLEEEVRDHGRQLARLYAEKSQLGI